MNENPFLPRIICIILLSCFLHVSSHSQTPNPCGVVAKISPAATDSVVHFGDLIDLTSQSINASSVEWLIDGWISGINGTNFRYQAEAGVHNISLVAHNGNCTDTARVFYFCAGQPHAIDSSMFANYGLFNTFEYGICMDATADGGFVLGGYGTLINDRGCGHQGLVVKLRDRGCVDWSRKIVDTLSYCGYGDVKKIYASPFDSSYYISGTGFLLKLDKNGNQVWNNIYRLVPETWPYYIDPIAMTGDDRGHLYMISRSINWGWIITSLDAAGNVLWNKDIQIGPNPDPVHVDHISNATSIVFLNGKLYVTGVASSSGNYFDFLTRLDPATGTIEWQYGYQTLLHPGSTSFGQVSTYGDLVMVAGTDGGGQGVFLIDSAGNLRKTINAIFNTSYAPHVTKAGADKQGNIYIMQWTELTLTLQPYFYYYTNFVKVDTSLHKAWGLIYPKWNFNDMAVSTNDFGATGTDFGKESTAFWGSLDMRFLKVNTQFDNLTNYQSNNSCNYYTNDYTLTTMPTNRLDFHWGIDSALTLRVVPVSLYAVKDAHIESRYTCPDFVDSCQFMKISGPVSACSPSNSFTYQLHRNRKCSLLPNWKLPNGVVVNSQTDSTITVQFPGFGVFGISCELNSCVPIFDSLTVIIKSKNARLDLGRDTVLCDQTSLKLHAGKSFLSYQWQDGSHDSTFNVLVPGLYWVEVADSCGNLLRDSISIRPYSGNQIDLGVDRSKCNVDTIHFSAPPGFLNYTWSPQYNISSTSAQTVVVNPSVDTSYFIKAEKTPGCFAFDTIRVRVFHSPIIDLGADLSFCTGDSVVLDAGGGFNSYIWNNNSTSSRYNAVRTTGTYSLVATTIEGCKSFDTVKVLNLWPLPHVALDKNHELCFGAARTLNAGSFSSYLWQDGSAGATYSVNDPGQYWVRVTDSHNCVGSDSVDVTTIIPLPAGFLPPDTSICSYGSLTLKPLQSFISYAWSTGNRENSIIITKAGKYWLQVVDQKGCTGRDTILVDPKQCMNGVYIPTAFTPNSDGKNDEFRAMVFGGVKKFELTVFNRWGQVIFKSTDPSKGWDGKIAGMEQRTDIFVWTCHYWLEGGTETTEKGTVTVIR